MDFISDLYSVGHGQPLTLAQLRAHDPASRRGGRESRFLCPLPACSGHRDGPRHRSLCVSEGGQWLCHRCGAKGLLGEYGGEAAPRPAKPSPLAAARARLALPTAPKISAAVPPDASAQARLGALLAGLRDLPGTPGADYLESRGLPARFCHDAGAMFSSDFFGRPAVVFKITGPDGALVALHGRYISGDADRKVRSVGQVKLGLFQTPGALGADPVAVVEAPIDALSLALCGVPAVALCGCSAPDWLAGKLNRRNVLLALDADPPVDGSLGAGDKAAEHLAMDLNNRHATVVRLRPNGAKDWNELLVQDGAALRDGIAGILLPYKLSGPAAPRPAAPRPAVAASAPDTGTPLPSGHVQDTGLETMEDEETMEDVETMENLPASPETLDDLEGLKMPADPEELELPTELEVLELPSDPEEPQMPSDLDSPGGTQPGDAGLLPLGTARTTVLTDRGEISEYHSQHLWTRDVIGNDIDAEPLDEEKVYRCSDLPLLAGLTAAEVVEVDRCLRPAVVAKALPRKPELKGTEAEIWDAYQDYGISADTTEPDATLLVTLMESLADRYGRSVGQRVTACTSGPSPGDRTGHMLARFVNHDTFIRVDARITPGDTASFELTFYSGDRPVELMHIPCQDGKVKEALMGIAVNHIGRQIDFHVPWEPGAWG